MSKKSLRLLMLSFSMWLIASLPVTSATEPGITGPADPHKIIPNKNEMFVDGVHMPETVDPAWCYDTPSKELIRNVYDTLVFFEWESTDEFVPSLATAWGEASPDPEYYMQIVFEIRDDVVFQLKRKLYTSVLVPENPISTQWVEETLAADYPYMIQSDIIGREYHLSSWIDVNLNGFLDAGDQVDLTRKDNGWMRYYHVESLWFDGIQWELIVKPKLIPEDVEYTFERWMIMGRTGGPAWMIYEALMGEYNANLGWPSSPTNPINLAVESDDDFVYFNFLYPYPTLLFLRIIAQPWAGILNRDWAIDQGCWDGNWANWLLYYDPPVSPLDNPTPVMMGTGPFCLNYIIYTVGWRIVRFDEHYQGWPAPGCSDYLDAVTYRVKTSWVQILNQFTSNDEAIQADKVDVPKVYTPQLEPFVQPLGWIRYIHDLPSLMLDSMLFNFHIPTSAEYPGNESPYIGNEQFSEYGTPADFFQDPYVRYGFAYAFNYNAFIDDIYLGQAFQPGSSLKMGEGFDDLYDEENPVLLATQFHYDPALAIAMFQQAWPGRVGLEGNTGLWETGFTFTIPYPQGNVACEYAATMLEAEIESYNPKFQIDVLAIPWSTFLAELVNFPIFRSKLPLCMLKWKAQLGDPHENFFVFYHTYGNFAFFQSWYEVEPDVLTVTGTTAESIVYVPNGIPDCDEKIEAALAAPTYADMEWWYRELMYEWLDDFPAVMLAQPFGIHYERTWVQGWYYNPLICFNPPFKYLWKGLDGDILTNHAPTPTVVNVFDFGLMNSYWHPGGLYPDGALGYNRIADVNDVNSAAWPSPGGYPTYGLMYPYDGLVGLSDAGYLNGHWGDCWP